jgi:hypothetical protein
VKRGQLLVGLSYMTLLNTAQVTYDYLMPAWAHSKLSGNMSGIAEKLGMSPSRHRRDAWICHFITRVTWYFFTCYFDNNTTHGLDILDHLAHSGDAIAVKKGRTSIDQPEPRRQGLPIPGRGRTQAAWACVLVAATRSNLTPARGRMRRYLGAGRAQQGSTAKIGKRSRI